LDGVVTGEAVRDDAAGGIERTQRARVLFLVGAVVDGDGQDTAAPVAGEEL